MPLRDAAAGEERGNLIQKRLAHCSYRGTISYSRLIQVAIYRIAASDLSWSKPMDLGSSCINKLIQEVCVKEFSPKAPLLIQCKAKVLHKAGLDWTCLVDILQKNLECQISQERGFWTLLERESHSDVIPWVVTACFGWIFADVTQESQQGCRLLQPSHFFTTNKSLIRREFLVKLMLIHD